MRTAIDIRFRLWYNQYKQIVTPAPAGVFPYHIKERLYVRMRNHQQSMGLWLNEPFLLRPETIRNAVEEMAAQEFGTVRLFLRNSNFTYRSPEFIRAVALAAQTAHRFGMKAVLDMEPHRILCRELGRLHPEATAVKLVRATAIVQNGFYSAQIPAVGNLAAEMPIFDGVEAAFLCRDGRIEAVELPFRKTDISDSYGDAGNVDEQYYVAGRPAAGPGRTFQLSGRLAPGTRGDLILYIRIRDLLQVDFAAPEFRSCNRETLALYREADLDGVGWDEPGCQNDWSHYRYGDRFAAFFLERKGYELKRELWRLDDRTLQPETVKVRLDYYAMLTEAMFEAQCDLIDYAAELFGRPMLTGTHHTWQGEGGINDYRAGAADYFRLNDRFDAGYTDCSWWDPKSVCYSYLLGSSLGRLTPSGECECNTWHHKPTIEQAEFHARLMSLYNITWFNIWYGAGDTCSFPSHYTWETHCREMRFNRDFQRALAGAAPETDIALLHDWQGICGVNRADTANLHKAFCLNFSHAAVTGNCAVDFVDHRLLRDGRVEDGRLHCRLGSYARVIVPFAAVLDRGVWNNLLMLADQGGELLFAGPPPQMDPEGGSYLEEFARLFDIEPVEFRLYHRWFACNHGPLPQARPERFDPVFPLDGEHVELDAEGRPGIIRGRGGRVRWFSGYEPHRPLLRHLLRGRKDGFELFGDALYRIYRRPGERLLALAAPKGGEFRFRLVTGGGEYQVKGGVRLLLELKPDGSVEKRFGDAQPEKR